MESKIKVAIINGSVRDNRFSESATTWIADLAKADGNYEVDILDLKEEDLPQFKSPVSPLYANGAYTDPKVQAWADKIKNYDAFIITAAEYNHGYTSAIKNALDQIYGEWNNKPVTFIGYGSTGGARAIEQLRQVVIELQMAPIQKAVHIMSPWLLRNEDGSLKDGVLDPYKDAATAALSQLLWWAKALKAAR